MKKKNIDNAKFTYAVAQMVGALRGVKDLSRFEDSDVLQKFVKENELHAFNITANDLTDFQKDLALQLAQADSRRRLKEEGLIK